MLWFSSWKSTRWSLRRLWTCAKEGSLGAVREIDGAQTVEIKHPFWIALLEAMKGLR